LWIQRRMCALWARVVCGALWLGWGGWWDGWGWDVGLGDGRGWIWEGDKSRGVWRDVYAGSSRWAMRWKFGPGVQYEFCGANRSRDLGDRKFYMVWVGMDQNDPGYSRLGSLVVGQVAGFSWDTWMLWTEEWFADAAYKGAQYSTRVVQYWSLKKAYICIGRITVCIPVRCALNSNKVILDILHALQDFFRWHDAINHAAQ